MAKDSLYRDKNLQVIFGVTLMAVLGVSSITPAFPSITRELGISGGQVGLLITFFTLPGAILAPFLGVLADTGERYLTTWLFQELYQPTQGIQNTEGETFSLQL